MKKPSKANLKCSLRINGKLILKNKQFMEIVSYLQNRNLINLTDDYYRVVEHDWKDNEFKINYNKIYADFKKLVIEGIECDRIQDKKA